MPIWTPTRPCRGIRQGINHGEEQRADQGNAVKNLGNMVGCGPPRDEFRE